ncbi:MAG: helix-turn-helix transcriptional regulator [Clostridia bacterium]|nr:helix-turn-helix transcriptional regulator [Clostridia bacterium]
MDTNFEKKFGSNLRRIRESKKMTQETVAAKMQLSGCDITRSALAKIEVAQRHIYADEILLLKEIYGVSFDELFYGNNR